MGVREAPGKREGSLGPRGRKGGWSLLAGGAGLCGHLATQRPPDLHGACGLPQRQAPREMLPDWLSRRWGLGLLAPCSVVKE